MRDFAVHEEPKAGGPRGWRRLILPFRRVLCRVLRPVFLRLADLLRDLDGDQRRLAERQERMGEQVDALLNRGWDQATLLRRLAALERQVEDLSQRVAAQDEAGGAGPPCGYYTSAQAPAAERRGQPR